MSSAVIRAPFPALNAAVPLETPFPEPGRSRLLELPRGVVPGAQLQPRPAPAAVPSGIAEIDALTGGFPRGALSEIFGPASSGRTSLLLAALAEATRRQEVCALVDAGDSLHPDSATAAGADLQRLLWVRCGENPSWKRGATKKMNDPDIPDWARENQRLAAGKPQLVPSPEISANSMAHQKSAGAPPRRFRGEASSDWEARLTQVLKTTDLLLQSGGFGMIVVDLAGAPPRFTRRIPLASWFRFRRAVENTPTVLLVVEQEPYAKTCASLVLKMKPAARGHQHSALHFRVAHATPSSGDLPPHARILHTLPIEVELVHARLPRKPARSVSAQFQTSAPWSNSVAG
ncbi:MAG TPA: hypothetical protein VLC12_09115 [Terriglobales bacterium]|nr:hypothetical protein [Terriglobales bacterium]